MESFESKIYHMGDIGDATAQDVEDMQEKLEYSMNKNSIKQMKMMERQAEQQLIMTNINHQAEMLNSAKQVSTKIQM